MQILTINSGSSSVRLGLYKNDQPLRAKAYNVVPESKIKAVLEDFVGDETISAVGHRIVHGGVKFSSPALMLEQTVEAIEHAVKLAPLHNPIALNWIKVTKTKFPNLQQVAVFDTAYFADLPEVAKEYALPQQITKQYGIYRYGFHGIAHEFMVNATDSLNVSKVITLQLGSGCSITAVKNGKPIDTSMGFTPLEGLMMATRPGDIDPGTLLYLLQEEKMEINLLSNLLNKESGLLGVSGQSADMQQLLNSTSAGAKKAIELFCYRAKKYVGAFTGALDGVDAIVFGGGIGQNSPEIRSKILSDMTYLGVDLDHNCNQTLVGKQGLFQSATSKVKLLVADVDEGQLIAKKTIKLLQ